MIVEGDIQDVRQMVKRAKRNRVPTLTFPCHTSVAVPSIKRCDEERSKPFSRSLGPG
jgi:hypothetical protein